ncbi:protein O-linked-mannose beta-1,2-N-acetylglucosaminyltransferase 1-like [Pollicipes pollicipes]|uniref:protein O-linked-mannose beta-1,2-N-acetylglucosaminyltransferase 1-like n=1 Tax=Pollicipes pollicipes TaxID=41117 RepID=UPI0018858589|nr:protein O-linked-mannose beta-1,2-N-acetylglucosaminyltransferase 1-like [Pollicipes pollicipes]
MRDASRLLLLLGVLARLDSVTLRSGAHGEALFRALNSSFAPDLQTRSVFALVAVKGGAVLGEGYVPNLLALAAGEPPGPTLRLAVTVPASERADCARTSDAADLRRREFCQRYDGYGALCDCDAPSLPAPPRPFADSTRFPYPVVVLASDRPRYLYRCLASLLPNRGLDPAKLVVFSDGERREVQELLRLLNVTSHTHFAEPAGAALRGAASRIGSAYRYTIRKAFELFPTADKLVLLEEDLEVSPDFVSFFQQTHHLLDEDVSLYCISAWNDHGYRHTVGDAALLYRVGFMPGLGWMLTRSLFFDELLPSWPAPGADFDWDVLVRHADRRKGRDCVVPDVPRTYHFGFQGGHVGSAMQYKYYWDHALNRQPDVRLKDVERMVLPRYTAQLMELLRSATKLDGSQSRLTCGDMIPSNATNQTYVLFVRMTSAADTAGWEKVATCLNLWDLDVRGDHHGVWRFFYNWPPRAGDGRAVLGAGRLRSEPRPRPDAVVHGAALGLGDEGLDSGQLGDDDDEEEDDEEEDDERLQDITSA